MPNNTSLDDSHSSSIYALGISLNQKGGSSSKDLHSAAGSTYSGMRSSMSMIELNNLPLLHGLNDELDALSVSIDSSSESSYPEG
eukprot:CAMPEP_0197838490 /NCGR_PEP_ID=MMETSP1437-20131217/36729_1 /TAXON_ID=49252 ORGANISM="Eucampia antarctica, Strain CCMP1452" /NCGR_SAMPLE_ID=MMETSP1437 /ASSEMBLY_ACC=CAM_ASM_001096 /LENGTH=84 /DNA_ID=CAMNT_0043446489 /DNA_START=92 /DNA_END=342 /DNA_ORIENTATION=+